MGPNTLLNAVARRHPMRPRRAPPSRLDELTLGGTVKAWALQL